MLMQCPVVQTSLSPSRAHPLKLAAWCQPPQRLFCWRTEAATRRQFDGEVVRGQLAGYKRYQHYIFILLLLLIVAGTVLAAIGADVLGWLLALSGIVPIVVRALLGVLTRGGDEIDANGETNGNSQPTPPSQPAKAE